MIKAIVLMRKRPELSREDFIAYYEQRHVPLVGKLAGFPTAYRRNFPIPGDPMGKNDDRADFDVVTELEFASREEMQAWRQRLLGDDGGKTLAEDEARFLDRASTRMVIVDVAVTT